VGRSQEEFNLECNTCTVLFQTDPSCLVEPYLLVTCPRPAFLAAKCSKWVAVVLCKVVRASCKMGLADPSWEIRCKVEP